MIRELKYRDLEELGLTWDEIQVAITKSLTIKKEINYIIEDGFGKNELVVAESLKDLKRVLERLGKEYE